MRMKKKMKEKFFLASPLDMNLILDLIFINIFGAIMIYSASFYYGPYAYGYTPEYIFMSQIKYVIPGIIFMILLSFVRPGVWKQFWPLYFILALGLLVAVKIPGLGWASHGAYRWIQIGPVRIQTAEPIKVLLILALGGYLAKFSVTRRDTLIVVFITACVFALGFLKLSNNMSTAMIVALMMFFTVFMIHPRQKWFWILMVIGVVAVVLGILYIDRMPYNENMGFRILRIKAWLHPDDPLYADDQAYQAQMARYAIASGGFFGKGLGRSLMKFTLPEPHNDYILAVIFEELGICGVLILTYLYIYLLYRLFVIFKSCRDEFSRVVILGVFFHIVFQVLINYCVTLGLFPTMGVTLPFVSAGGSSAFFTLAEIGFCLGIDKQNKEYELYKIAEKEIREEDLEYKNIMDERKARANEWKNRRRQLRRVSTERRANVR